MACRSGAWGVLAGIGSGCRASALADDLKSAAERIRATAYPQAEQFAAQSVLRPPSEEDTLAAFARAEVGAELDTAADGGA